MHQRGAAATMWGVLYNIYAAQLSADEKRKRKKKKRERAQHRYGPYGQHSTPVL